MSISTPHIRTNIITVSMAMLLVGLLTGHFEIQQLSITKKKRENSLIVCCLSQVEDVRQCRKVTGLIELFEVHWQICASRLITKLFYVLITVCWFNILTMRQCRQQGHLLLGDKSKFEKCEIQ